MLGESLLIGPSELFLTVRCEILYDVASDPIRATENTLFPESLKREHGVTNVSVLMVADVNRKRCIQYSMLRLRRL